MKLWQATLRISRPGTTVTDDAVTYEITAAHSVTQKDLRAVKRLWGNSIAPLESWERQVRKYHRERTFAGIGDIRLLIIAERDAYLSRMASFAADHTKLRARFLSDYETHIEAERSRLNGTFNIDDYPTPERLADLIGFTYGVQPMPTPNQFLVDGLTDDTSTRLAEEYRQRLENTERNIRRQILHTMLALISATAESLSGSAPLYDSEAKKSPIVHLREYLDRVPSLNYLNDPQITALYNETRARLDVSTETLRTNPVFRQNAALHAQVICAKHGTAAGFGGTKRRIATDSPATADASA